MPNDLVANSCCLTLAGATQVLEVAISHATAIRRALCIAVTDTSGEPIVTARMDGAPRMSADIAANNAYVAYVAPQSPSPSRIDPPQRRIDATIKGITR